MGDRVKNYLLSQLDKTTAWIGVIGLTLQFLGLGSFLFLLFVFLVFLPESSFSNLFKKWTGEIRDIAADEPKK